MHFPLRKGRHSSIEEKATLLALIDSVPDPTVVIDGDGRIVLVNAACERVFGYSRNELLHIPIESILPDIFGKVSPATPYRGATPIDTRAVGKGGGIFPVQLLLAYLPPGQDVLASITVRHLPVQQPPGDRQRKLLEAVPDPLFFIAEDGTVTDLNEAAVVATGRPRENMVGTDFSRCFTDPPGADACLREVFVKGKATDCSLVMKPGSDVLINAALYSDDGKEKGCIAVARDVTAAMQPTHELAEAKNYLDNILQSSTKYSIVGIDQEWRILSWNEGGRRNYGYAADEIVGKQVTVLHTREDLASGAVDAVMARAWEEGVAEAEFTRVRKDGTRFEASVVVTRRDDLAGRPIGYLMMSSDISDRKEAEDRLRQAALYSRSLIEASLDPLVTISPEGKITDVNEATVRATGVTREEMAGSDFALYFTDPEQARQAYRQVFQQGHLTDYPLTMRHRSGTVTEVVYNASVYTTTAGTVIGAFAAARDVTQRKRLDEELKEAASIIASSSAQIMASIAQVASGATETAATVSETTAVAEQVKATAHLTSSKAHAVLDVAQKAVTLAQSGRNSVEESVSRMGLIREEMISIAERITSLSEQSQAIGEIIDTVKDLAEQSNLLSVNAAIEAAKAGEFGRGFDVVAQEVKALAAESKKATTRVRGILSDIEKATKGAVQATEQGRTGVEVGVRQTTEAGEAIRQMAETIELSAEAAAQIAASTQEHLEGMDQISTAMNNIKEASHQNVTGMRQVEETLQNLHSLGQKLKQLVEQYK